VAVVESAPLDRLLREVKLGNAIGDPVEQLKPVGVAVIHCGHRGVDSGGGVGAVLGTHTFPSVAEPYGPMTDSPTESKLPADHPRRSHVLRAPSFA
jgi:hypothetical protein